MNINVKNRFRHNCELSNQDLIYTHTPHLKRNDSWSRKLRDCMTVTSCEESRRCYRSHAELFKAKRHHLTRREYRFIVHPFSIFARREVGLKQLLWFLVIWVENFAGSFLPHQMYHIPGHNTLLNVLYLANVLFFIDVIFKFFTGYVEEVTRTVVLEPRAIFHHYLKTFFFFDCVPVVGYLLYYHWKDAHPMTYCLLFQLHKFRLVRIKRVVDRLDHTLDDLRVSETIRKCVEVIMYGVIMLHVLTCLSGLYIVILNIYQIPSTKSWYTKVKYDQQQKSLNTMHEEIFEDFLMTYVTHLYNVCCHFFAVFNVMYRTEDPIEMVFLSSVLICGLCYHVFCAARIVHHMSGTNLSESKYEALSINAECYMQKKNFPTQLKSRINDYYQYKFDKKYFDEASILGTLSQHLQMEVLLYSCQNLINRVHIFKGLSTSAVGCILSLMKQDIFVPKDHILEAWDKTESIYFILFGTCGLQFISGKEVMHIEDGDHFGNLPGFQYDRDNKWIYDIVALEMVEVFRLDKESINYCVRMYPEIQAKLEGMERTRMRRYERMFSMRDENEDVTEDIVNELRRGRILRHGINREAFR